MRKSLFALENDDNLDNAAEMEVSGEEGEAAAALTETGDDTGEIAEVAEAASEGTEAADQLGQVEELVEDAVENGEGLDPVAAEAVRISVEAICARIGANPRSVYSLYATENFQSASSRKANSRIALEGIGEFLKNLYEKIKAALSNMWTKIKAFWAKHISTLGRVKKALEAMKTKVSSSSGKIEGRSVIDEAPSSMIDAFAGTGSLGAAAVSKYVEAHAGYTKSSAQNNASITGFNTAAANINANPGGRNNAATQVRDAFKNFHDLGDKTRPLVGGVYIVYEVEANDSDEDKVTVTVNRETIDNKETKRTFVIAGKDEVKDILTKTLTVINETIKVKDSSDKLETSLNKFLQAVSKTINEKEKGDTTEKDTENTKALRNQLTQTYSLNSKLGSQSIEMLNMNIRLAKAVLGFSALCLKNYK